MALRPALLLILAASALSCFGQQSKQSPTFTAKSELVIVPVVVTSGGVAVEGLAAKDFSIRQDGKLVQIATFEMIDTRPFAPVAEPKLPARTTQNFLPGGERRQDLVILLLDFLNSSWSSGARIRSYLLDLAKQLEKTETPFAVCVTTSTGMVQIQSIGNDPHDFLRAIEAWESKSANRLDITKSQQWTQPFVPIETAQTTSALYRYAIARFDPNRGPAYGKDLAAGFELDRAMMTAQAFEQIAEAYSGIPGRKKLVWFSIGMPGNTASFESWGGPEAMSDARIAEKTGRAVKALSTANITIYPVDANGVVNPTWEEHFSAAIDPLSINKTPSAFAEQPTNLSSLLELADRTGGSVCTLTPDRCLTRVMNDGDHYYVLGFYLGHQVSKGWHKLNVKVARDNVSVRTRSGFLVGDLSNEHWVQNDMILTALASPLDYTSIPVSLHWDLISEPGRPTNIELAISSPPRGISSDPSNGNFDIDLLAYVRPTGKTEGISYPTSLVRSLTPDQQRDLATNGFRFRKLLQLAPGTYEVRLLLRDNVAKKMGTVSTVITVKAPSEP
jgi:VWFA-related protein